MANHRLTQGAGRYVKLAGALFGAIASAVVALGLTGGSITMAEWVNIGIAAVGAFQVWYVTETSDNPNGKAVIAAVSAGLVVLASFLTGGGHVNLTEWMQVGMAALTATGIWAAPSLAPKTTGLKLGLVGNVAPDVKSQVQQSVNYIQSRYGTIQNAANQVTTTEGVTNITVTAPTNTFIPPQPPPPPGPTEGNDPAPRPRDT